MPNDVLWNVKHSFNIYRKNGDVLPTSLCSGISICIATLILPTFSENSYYIFISV